MGLIGSDKIYGPKSRGVKANQELKGLRGQGFE